MKIPAFNIKKAGSVPRKNVSMLESTTGELVLKTGKVTGGRVQVLPKSIRQGSGQGEIVPCAIDLSAMPKRVGGSQTRPEIIATESTLSIMKPHVLHGKISPTEACPAPLSTKKPRIKR